MMILSVDFGTSSIKMAVYNPDGTPLRSAKVEYAYEVLHRVYVQMDVSVIYAAFLQGCRELADLMPQIDVIVPCVFSPCLVVMDRDGNPLLPAILHLDRRSYVQSRFAMRQIGKEAFLQISGNLPFAGGISATSMLWVKDNHPQIYHASYKLGHLNTYIHRRLTGNWLIDPSNASFTGLYETCASGGWSKLLCSGLGIDAGKLPDLAPSLSLAGKLTASAAQETGMREGLPVIMGANDTTAAAYGAGATHPGDILNISGSSEILTVTTDHPIPHEKYYTRTSMEAGKWLCLAITVGGFALEWFRSTFCAELAKDAFYNRYLPDVLERQIKPTARFLPHLSGDRHSLLPRKGAFTRLTLDTTREEMLAALLIGTYDPVLSSLRVIGKQLPLGASIFWTGGMISEVYQDFKGRVFKDYTFIRKSECSTLGNVQAAKAVLHL